MPIVEGSKELRIRIFLYPGDWSHKLPERVEPFEEGHSGKPPTHTMSRENNLWWSQEGPRDQTQASQLVGTMFS